MVQLLLCCWMALHLLVLSFISRISCQDHHQTDDPWRISRIAIEDNKGTATNKNAYNPENCPELDATNKALMYSENMATPQLQVL